MSFEKNLNKWRFYNVFSVKEKMLSLLGSELKHRNIYDTRLISRWSEIVGKEVADKLIPVNISIKYNKQKQILEKTLYCYTNNLLFATEFQFLKNNILNKLNAYFGDKKSVFKNIVTSILS